MAKERTVVRMSPELTRFANHYTEIKNYLDQAKKTIHHESRSTLISDAAQELNNLMSIKLDIESETRLRAYDILTEFAYNDFINQIQELRTDTGVSK